MFYRTPRPRCATQRVLNSNKRREKERHDRPSEGVDSSPLLKQKAHISPITPVHLYAVLLLFSLDDGPFSSLGGGELVVSISS